MSEPNLNARELMQSSRDLLRPTLADRERIQKALRARLGVAAIPPLAHGATHDTSLYWLRISSAVMGAVCFAAALLIAFGHASRARVPALTAPLPVAAPASSDSTSTRPAELAPVPVLVAAVSADRPRSAARFPDDQLGQEVALLARAVSDLHAGRTSEALKSLDQHQRRFPNGALAEERRAARAQVLCSLGRQDEAQAEIAQLSPESPAAARAEQVCEASTKAEQ